MTRLIAFIVIFAIFLVFIVLNLNNSCDISLGFITLNDIPVFLSSLSSFIMGMLVTIPLMLFRSFRKKKKDKAKLPPNTEKVELTAGPEKINKENSPYGID